MTSQHEPLSWLTLERYALGELSQGERAQVEARLAESEADRAVLAAIMNDSSELAPLPVSVPADAAPGATVHTLPGRGHKGKARLAWLSLSTGLAAAAALLLFWRGVPSSDIHGRYDGVKGSEFALRLISDRSGPDPRAFQLGERFKVEITCPASHQGPLRVLIFQGDERFEPLPATHVPCGNLVAWPGAFSLDGVEPAQVCLYAGTDSEPARGATKLTCTTLSAK